EQLEVDEDVIDEYIGIYEARARTGRNGAWWQRKTLGALAGRAPVGSVERDEALLHVVRLYTANQGTGRPVLPWVFPWYWPADRSGSAPRRPASGLGLRASG